MAEIKNITLTVIFEGQALNRDEKLAGNILSIKKLSYLGNEFSYISKPAVRHYLFNTLLRAYPEDWKEASVSLRQGDNKEKAVIQFDITKDDIFTSAELDAFGYMYTIKGQNSVTRKGENSVTRKATVGITKAVSLLPYQGDIQFNANHDLTKRAISQGMNATPDPTQKEENLSLYKVSFTIDAKCFGEDVWIVEGFEYKDNLLIVQVNKLQVNKPMVDILFNEVEIVEQGDIVKFKVKDGEVIIKDGMAEISEELVKKLEDGTIEIEMAMSNKNEETEKVKLSPEYYDYDKEEKVYRVILSEDYKYDKDKKTLLIKTRLMKLFRVKEEEKDKKYSVIRVKEEKKGEEVSTIEEKLGYISFSPVGNKYKMVFSVDSQIKAKRIRQILESIKNGLVAHSSGEDNTMIPLFIIAAPVKVPSPVFHPYIHLGFNESKPRILGLKDCIQNSWLEDNIYLYVSDRLQADIKPFEEKTYKSWDEFLRSCGLLEKEENQNASASP